MQQSTNIQQSPNIQHGSQQIYSSQQMYSSQNDRFTCSYITDLHTYRFTDFNNDTPKHEIQLVRHVIDSSCWRHTRRVTFPGGARHAATTQRVLRWDIPSTGPSSAVHAPAAPHAPASFRRCEGLEAGDDSHAESDFRQTRAVGGVPASVTRQRPISRRADKGQRDSSAPRSIKRPRRAPRDLAT